MYVVLILYCRLGFGCGFVRPLVLGWCLAIVWLLCCWGFCFLSASFFLVSCCFCTFVGVWFSLAAALCLRSLFVLSMVLCLVNWCVVSGLYFLCLA